MNIFKIDNHVNYNIYFYEEQQGANNPYLRDFSLQIEYFSNISIKAVEGFLNRVLEREFKSDIIKWLDKKFDILQYGRVENFEFEVYQNGKYIVVEIKF
jgi:hypothetical protein